MQSKPIHILPEYAIILTYDIKRGLHERYFRYISSELLPALQARKIYMQHAWHVVYGEHPQRQIEFITEELDAIKTLVDDPEWLRLENRLKTYTENYQMRIVRYKGSVKI